MLLNQIIPMGFYTVLLVYMLLLGLIVKIKLAFWDAEQGDVIRLLTDEGYRVVTA